VRILIAARLDGAAKTIFRAHRRTARTHPGTRLFRQIQNQIITHPHREWVDRTLPVTGEAGAAGSNPN
jgi:hypothetical protein